MQRVALATDLARAVNHGELVLHFQPLVSLATGRLAGLEALLRWNHPTLGLLAPAQFMDLAEETGAIVPIGAWVVDEACRQTRLWKNRHPDFLFTISVNVSPKQLHEGAIVDTVRSALRRWEIQPCDLVLELTEGVMLNDSDLTVARLHELKALGVMLAIDDFGTGYSSLSYLRRLPFDCLKIDKLFVDGITSGPTESAFALAIIKLAQTLGLETVAEGVEQPEQVAHLRALGCELAQGYHFARPLAVEAVDALLGSMVGDGWGTRVRVPLSVVSGDSGAGAGGGAGERLSAGSLDV